MYRKETPTSLIRFLQTRTPHPAAALLKHMRVHGVPIKIERGMKDKELTRAIRYVANSSATKETTFVQTELQEQAQEVHIPLFPLQAVHHLTITT